MRQDKHFLLDEVVDSIDHFGDFFIVRYHALLKANLANEFRRSVMRLNGDFCVMRKRVLAKAAAARGVSLGEMGGHVGFVFSSADPVAMSKALLDFSEENEQCIELLGGYVEQRLFSAGDIVTLSKLPSKQEMQAQLLAVLEAPLSQTLSAMDALISSVVYCLDNKIKGEGN